jgi:hypothetical protein
VSAVVDPDLKEQFQNFGSVKSSESQCLSPFIICACAQEDPQLMAEGLGLLSSCALNTKSPGISIEEAQSLIDVLLGFGGETVSAADFVAPKLVQNAASGLANVAAIGSEYRQAIGTSKSIELFLGWLQAPRDEYSAAAVCSVLAELCKEDTCRGDFLTKNGLAAVMNVLATEGKCPARFENALQVIVVLCMSDDDTAHQQIVSAQTIELLLQVMASHKTSNSAAIHQQGATALHWLLQHDGSGSHRTVMMECDVARVVLSCLVPRVTTSESADIIGELLVTLLATALEQDTLATDLLDGLAKIRYVMLAFLTVPSTQTVYMGAIAGLCVSPDHKKAIMEAELIESVVTAMLEHPEDVRLQEQACHTLCDISRSADSIRDYMADVLEDSFYFGFNLIQTIVEGLKSFVEDLDFVEAACSASWSVAIRCPKMKTKAADAGVFEIMAKVIQVHQQQPDILAHCFGAISNLVANHDPNKIAAGSSGMIKQAIECLYIYQREPVLCRSILTTLQGMMEKQEDNMDRFEDEGGIEIIAAITAIFKGARDETAAEVAEKADVLTSIISERAENIAEKKKKADAGKMSVVEFREQQDHPLKALTDAEKTTIVQKGLMMVQHKDQKQPMMQLCILYKHELVCFEDPERSKTMKPLATYHLALFTSLQINPKNAKKFSFETLNKSGAIMNPSTVTEAKVWFETLRGLQPTKSAMVQAADRKKNQSRYIAWQSDVLFMLGEHKKEWTVRRAYMAKDIKDIRSGAKELEFTESVHGDTWKFLLKDTKEPAAWATFLTDEAEAIVAKLEHEAQQLAEKESIVATADREAESLRLRQQAEEAWFDEEADRRLIALMVADESVEEQEAMHEFHRMETEAALEEEARKAEQELREKRKIERLKRDEERQKALDSRASQKDLRDYIDALKEELAATRKQIDTLKEKNAPLQNELDDTIRKRESITLDYVARKKDFDKLVGGRLGHVSEAHIVLRLFLC